MTIKNKNNFISIKEINYFNNNDSNNDTQRHINNSEKKGIKNGGKTCAVKILTAIIIAAACITGCAESRINSVTTDSPYIDVEKPVLAIKNEHFGGGYTLENGKRTYPAGGKIYNFGNQPAYSVTIRIRIYNKNGGAFDDHNIYLGDIAPAGYAAFDETCEVPGVYGDSEITLTYQDDSKIHTMLLKPSIKNINNLDKNSY